MIPKAIAAINLHKDPSIPSTIEFGLFNYNYRNASQTLTWWPLAVNNTIAWNLMMSNAFYHNSSINDNVQHHVILDPFFGGVHIPIPIWTALFTELAAMMVYLECDFSVTFQCTYPTTCA